MNHSKNTVRINTMPVLAAAVLASTIGGTYLGMSQTDTNGQHVEAVVEQPGVTQLHPGRPVTAAPAYSPPPAVSTTQPAALDVNITAQETTRVTVVANPNTDPIDPSPDWNKYVGQLVVVEFRTTASLSGLNSVVGPSPFAYDNKPDVGLTWAVGILAAADDDKVSLVIGPYKDDNGRVAWRHTMSIPAETVFGVSMLADPTQ